MKHINIRPDAVKNKLDMNKVTSNLYKPTDYHYEYICRVQLKWFKDHMKTCFNYYHRTLHVVDGYAVNVNGKLYHNKDGEMWLIKHRKDLY